MTRAACRAWLVLLTLVALPATSRAAEDRAEVTARALRTAKDRLQRLREMGPLVKAFVAQGTDVAPIVVVLADLLHDPDIETRVEAAQALGEAGPVARAAAPGLRATLQDPNLAVRTAGAAALVDIGAPGDDLLPVLREGIAHKHFTAVRAAGRLGAAAAPLMDALLDLASWTDDYLVQAAREAVGQVDPARVTEFDARASAARRQRARALVDELRSWSTAWPAHQALYALGAASVPLLAELLKEKPDRSLPRAVMIGPSGVGPGGTGVAVMGPGELADMPRWHAARILGEIGTPASDAVPALCAVLGDTSESATVRFAAAEALGRIHSRPEESVRALTAALGDPTRLPVVFPLAGVATGDTTLRGVAAQALGLFGQRALGADGALARAQAAETSPAMLAAIREARDRIHRPSAEQLAALAEERERTVVNGLKHFRDPVSGIAFDYPERYRARESRAPDGTLDSVHVQDGGRPSYLWDFHLVLEGPDGFTSLEGTNLDFGVRRAQLHCSATGDDGSVSCPEVRARTEFRARSGLRALEATLVEEEERQGRKSRRPKTVFVVDVSPPSGIRVLLLMPLLQPEGQELDIAALRQMARSVRVVAR